MRGIARRSWATKGIGAAGIAGLALVAAAVMLLSSSGPTGQGVPGVSAAPGDTAVVTTALSATTITLGNTVNDTVTVTGGATGGAPTGSVTVTAYTDNVCTSAAGLPSRTAVLAQVGSTNASSAVVGTFQPSATGTYYFKAQYNTGTTDPDYADAVSDCSASHAPPAGETLVVTAAATNEDCVLRTSKDADVSEVAELGTITYTIKVKNVGNNDNGDCTNLDVTDVIPDDTDCTDATVTSDSDIDEGSFDISGCDTSGTVEWSTDDNLDTGSEVVLTMVVKLTSGASDGDTITNEACADSDTAVDNDCDSVDVDVTAEAATSTPLPTATTAPVAPVPTARPIVPPAVIPTAAIAPLVIPNTGSGPGSSSNGALALALGLTGGALLLLGGTGVWLRRRS